MNTIKYSILNNAFQTPDELYAVFDAIANPVIVFNPAGIVVMTNQAARDFLPFKPDGLNAFEFTQKATSGGEEYLPVSRALKGESIKNAQFMLIDNSGKLKICSGSLIPVSCRDNWAGTVFTWQDLAEKERQMQMAYNELEDQVKVFNEKQKKSNKRIRNDKKKIDFRDSQIYVSNKLLEIIFSNTHFLIAYLSVDFNFIQVNDAYAKAFGKSQDFFPGKNHFEIFPNAENRAIFENVVKTGDSYVTYAKSFFSPDNPDNGITYWDWSLKPIINDNIVEGIILVLIDVTRRKIAEDELFNSKRLSDIGILAATVAHELRNPLGVIQAAVYNIKRKCHNPELDKHIKNIYTKIGESEQIINNLLTYSRLKIPQLEEIFIFDFLNALFDDIRSQKIDNKVMIHRKYEDLKNIAVRIDPYQIREVLNNIVNNAYQSLPQANGSIEILGSQSENNHLNLTITDNGEGIEEEDLEKIFNPFFTKRSKGTGLGLTICRELIKLHNGNIEIQSQRGKGTTVRIMLPVKVSL